MLSLSWFYHQLKLLEDSSNVIQTKFAQKLATKKGMFKMHDVKIPVSPTDKTPFKCFETEKDENCYYILGVREDGQKEKIAHGKNKEAIEMFVQIYNTGGYTDKDIQEIVNKGKSGNFDK